MSHEKSHSTLFSETPIQVNERINEDRQVAESSAQGATREKQDKFILNTELLSDEEDDEEELGEKNNYFQFLENQKLNEESDYYDSNSNSDQESEEQIDYDESQETRLVHSHGNNKEGIYFI